MPTSGIVVIIAAYNAQEMIGRAIKSALAEPEVAEVIVVDDASPDDTAKAARKAGNADKRLKVFIQPTNKGPSAARNLAIRESTSPFIAILDADDFFLKNRFKHIMASSDWDFYADNIVFISTEEELKQLGNLDISEENVESRYLDFHSFVDGNISRRTVVRGELGFLKPVMRRKFLEINDIYYNENCRLGEDYLLYAHAIAKGARFKISNNCGYVALVRKNSLSGSHKISDLKSLHEAATQQLSQLLLDQSDLRIYNKHLSSLSRKIVHREVLQKKAKDGLLPGLAAAARNPITIIDILQDRIAPPSPNHGTPRKLLQPEKSVQK